MNEEVRASLMLKLETLQHKRNKLTAVNEFIALESEDAQQRLADIQRRLDDLQEEMEVEKLQLREELPENFHDKDETEAEIDRLEKDIKKVIHSLPIEEVKKGSSLEFENVKVTIGSVKSRKDYDVPSILGNHPEYEELSLDGDPLVVRALNEAVLERLIALEQISANDIKPFCKETKVRNPSVRIT